MHGEILLIRFSDLCPPLESALIDVINRGYNKPRYRYGVIDTPRIKHSLLRDLNIKDPEQSYLALFLAPKSDTLIERDDTAAEATNKFISKFPEMSFPTRVSQLDDYSDVESRILGTVGIRKIDRGHELTAFTSFYPQLSGKMMDFIHGVGKNVGSKTIVADVIAEHNLVEFYEKHQYREVRRIPCKIDKQTNLVIGSVMEDGVKAKKDFTMVEMERVL
ncbi:hypothetical protein KL933_002293 [Ogataea haglerorum]|uniref:Uncharacterized protein n=1 Tax=Ogataea haglerorum TaxID=1937702 RepID=A0AAN6I1R8_9ASCO|nr:hypothetical protein KL915_004971 [Ogataea haglerorum]KAG7692658.1 hypothetical protein KL951_004905 [Ogataea haglerorum]KAG7702878.1 hypothetical protein KL950_004956 [Ogataea haglerorum]KAG7702975.1 hypothetical protein KL914_004980 [Ogataea haglerorum]KAG7718975.1 hypothetical protein KL913_001973 [Ogataea haglerorum]